MMDKINISELDNLIYIYFGQDHDLILDTVEIEPKIDVYIASSHKGMKHALIADIDLFLNESDDPDKDFAMHYGTRFVPAFWGTTATIFLQLIRERVSAAILQDEYVVRKSGE